MTSSGYPPPQWNATTRDYPSSELIHTLFEQQAARRPDAVALRSGDETLGYAELNRKANRLARHLLARGAGPRTLVGINVPRSTDMVTAVLAVLKTGGAYVPLDPGYPLDRLSFKLQDAAAPLLITTESGRGVIQPFDGTTVAVDTDRDAIDAQSADNLPRTAEPGDLAYVIYTSGSTGTPKGVQITHRSVVNFISSIQMEPGISEGDVLAAQASLSFDMSVLDLFVPLASGACVLIVPTDVAVNGRRLLALLAESGTTIMQATPSTWRLLLQAGLSANAALTAFVGGEALPSDVAQALVQHVRAVWNLYGPTETTVYSVTTRFVEGKPLIGRPIANTQIHILDEHLQPVHVGEIGELHIGGLGLARGYLNRPELTAEKFIADPFGPDPASRLYKTGDLARYEPNGEIECLGRNDQQVKIRGYRIELGEVEALLRQFPGVRDAVVVSRADHAGAQRLVAYVAPPQVVSFNDTAPLKRHLLQRLPDFMVPRTFVFLDTLPLSPNLKVDRSALPEPTAAISSESGFKGDDAMDEFELGVAQVWAKTLGRSSVGLRDDFFDIGGDSMSALVAIMGVEARFGQTVPLDAMWADGYTVAGLARIVRKSRSTKSRSRLVNIRAGSAHAPLFVMHTARGSVNEYFGLAYRMSADHAVIGVRAKGVFGEALPSASIEALATDAIEAIQSQYPQGPYRLAGFSIGGLIAFEVGLQLHRLGHDVAFLGLLDTMAPGLQPSTTWRQRFRWRMGALWSALRGVAKPADAPKGLSLDERSVASKHSIELQKILLEAENIYRPTEKGAVTLHLFIAKHTARHAPDPTLGWRTQVSTDIRLHLLGASDHLDVVRQSGAADTARALERCLLDADRA